MLKISSQYLERFLMYYHLTEKFWQLLTYMCTNWPILYACRPTIAMIFQLNDNKSEIAQDIDLKFSAIVYHMSGINWQKKFTYCSISGSVAPSSVQKLWTPLATIFVEKTIWKKKIVVVLDPFELSHERNFLYLEKTDVLKFFKRAGSPEPVVHE